MNIRNTLLKIRMSSVSSIVQQNLICVSLEVNFIYIINVNYLKCLMFVNLLKVNKSSVEVKYDLKKKKWDPVEVFGYHGKRVKRGCKLMISSLLILSI